MHVKLDRDKQHHTNLLPSPHISSSTSVHSAADLFPAASRMLWPSLVTPHVSAKREPCRRCEADKLRSDVLKDCRACRRRSPLHLLQVTVDYEMAALAQLEYLC